MTYATENAKDSVERNFLVVLTPKRRVTSWTLHSGSVYKNTFSSGYVTSVYVNGTALTLGTSASLSAGEFYYDFDTGIVYIRKSAGTPSGSDWIIVRFELYLSTSEVYWYRDPLDTSTARVLYRGVISSPPYFSRSFADLLFGYAPSTASALTCENDHEYFQEMIYDSSFNQAVAEVYHVAGRLTLANISQIFTGISGSPQMTDSELTIPLIDKNWGFDAQIGNGSYADHIDVVSASSFSTYDPVSNGLPIRTAFGAVGMRGFAKDYSATSSTAANRRWAFSSVFASQSTIVATISAAATAYDAVIPIAIARRIVNFPGAPYVIVTDGVTQWVTSYSEVHFSGGVGYVVLNDPRSAVGRQIYFPAACSVRLKQGNAYYTLRYGRDYSESADTNCITVDLNASAEANAGISTIDMTNGDFLYVVGRPEDPSTYTWNGQDILPLASSGTTNTPVDGWDNPFTNPVSLLFYILKKYIGLQDSEIDGAAFQAVAAAMTSVVSFCSPETESGDFKTYKEIITKLLNSMMCHGYFNGAGVFTIVPVDVTGTSQLTITDEDIVNEPRFEFNHDDISKLEAPSIPYEFDLAADGSTLSYRKTYSSNYDGNLYQHGSGRVISIETYLVLVQGGTGVSPFTSWMTKAKELLGERRGRVRLVVKAGAHDLDLGDTVTLSREKLPGYSYVAGTLRSRDFVIIEIQKRLDEVELLLDDQKAIQDNTGDW